MNDLPPELKCMIAENLNTQDRLSLARCSKEWYELLWQPIQIQELFFDLIFLMQAESYSYWNSPNKNYVVSNFSFFLPSDRPEDPIFDKDIILFGFTYVYPILYLKFKKDTIGETPFLDEQIQKIQVLDSHEYHLDKIDKNEMEWSKQMINGDLESFHEEFVLIIRLFDAKYHEIFNMDEMYQLFYSSLLLSILLSIHKNQNYCPDDVFNHGSFYWYDQMLEVDIHNDKKVECKEKMRLKSKKIYESIKSLDRESIYRLSKFMT